MGTLAPNLESSLGFRKKSRAIVRFLCQGGTGLGQERGEDATGQDLTRPGAGAGLLREIGAHPTGDPRRRARGLRRDRYRGGSLREIAASAGLSEPGILHHFPSKAALLAAVLERRDEHAEEIVRFDPTDPDGTLRGLVALARQNSTTPGVVELFCVVSSEATSPEHPAHAYFVDRYEKTRDRLIEAYVRLAEDGRLRPGVDPRRSAVETIALMDGLQVQWLLDRDVVDMPEALEAHFTTSVSGFEMPADSPGQ